MIERAQTYMQENAIDGWLMYDFRGSNPVFWQSIGLEGRPSRRNYVWIPASGDACALIHFLDKNGFGDLKLPIKHYVTWQELQRTLADLLSGSGRVAMEYSPGNAIPIHSYVDAGTVELVRSLGVEVVSSANLFQVAATSWSGNSVRLHRKACIEVNEVKDASFHLIGEKLRAGETVYEHDIAQFIRDQFDRRGLYIDHGPTVALNEHSGDPHYSPSPDNPTPIRAGDWILIDLWGKYHDPEAIYCDITWTAYAGSDVPEKHQEVYNTVTGARDAVVAALQDAWHNKTPLQGWQMDRVAREFIDNAGYGDFFTHRTGHSMGVSPTPHALGVNLDDYETHDTRAILPGVGFSVEPGVYLPEFGVRSEIDMYVDPVEGPVVTSSMQGEILRIY